MRFLDPLLLAGLAAALLPLIIHLINRRRAVVHRFAAIDLVLRSNKRTARAFRLKQLLLLAVRTLAIAAIPFALARPYVVTEAGVPVVPKGTPTSVVLVLDDSLSMGWSDGGDTLLERAKEEARGLLADLGEQDNAALVLAGAPPRSPVGELTFDLRAVGEAVDRAVPSVRATDLAGALTLAAGLLSGTTGKARRVVVLSDLQAAGFEPARLPPPSDDPPEVVVIDLAAEGGGANRAVTGVTAEPAPEAGSGAWRFDVTVAASGSEPASDVPLSLELGDEVVARGLVTAKTGERVTKTFTVPLPETGMRRGRVVLEADGLPEDDARGLSVRLRPSLQVLVVNGDPRAIPWADEVFYLERALLPAAGTGSRLRPRVLQPAALATEELSGTDVVILANVGEVPPGVPRRLESWVRAGGGLLVTAGDRLDPDHADWLASLLPGELVEVRAAGPGVGGQPLRLGPVPATDQLFGVFAGPGGEGLRAATFSRHLLVEPSLEADRRVLLAYADGSPALLERRLGRGRVLLLTTSADLDWSDLAASTGFLPLVQELCHHVARSPVRRTLREVVAGTPAVLRVPEGAQAARRTGPDGDSRDVDASAVAGRRELTLEDTWELGVHTVEYLDGEGEPLGEEDLVVTPLAAESDLTPLAPEVRAALAGHPADVRSTAAASPERRADVWPWALLLLVVLLLSEATLLVRRRRPEVPLPAAAPEGLPGRR